jgi:hypothetical protein
MDDAVPMYAEVDSDEEIVVGSRQLRRFRRSTKPRSYDASTWAILLRKKAEQLNIPIRREAVQFRNLFRFPFVMYLDY